MNDDKVRAIVLRVSGELWDAGVRRIDVVMECTGSPTIEVGVKDECRWCHREFPVRELSYDYHSGPYCAMCEEAYADGGVEE